jgi:hypothetical protein
VDYVIYDISISDQIVTFDLLNDHEHDSNHRHLTQNLNVFMHRSVIQENSNNKRQLLFGKSKVDIFLKDLNSELHILNYKDNIEDLYHNFTSTLSTSINKFSFEVSYKKTNRSTNPWYDKECKFLGNPLGILLMSPSSSIRSICTNSYLKGKKMYYINNRKEQLLHLYKLDSKKLWRQILICNTKENNMIPLRDWNSYLKSLYEFPNSMETIPIVPT